MSFPLLETVENAKFIKGLTDLRFRLTRVISFWENQLDMAWPRYDTVREQCYPSTETIVLSFICQNVLQSPHFVRNGPNADSLDRVKEVIETAVTGRKYEVLLLRSQGKSMSEIALILSISKSTVQSYYRQGVRQVRQALGVEPQRSKSSQRNPC
jgi:DNA-binding CsgD family transcriptional regulator